LTALLHSLHKTRSLGSSQYVASVIVRRCSLLARRNDDWLTRVLLLGLEGKAGSTVSLDDEWEDAGAAAPKETTVLEKVSSAVEKPVSQATDVSDEGLSLVVKLLLAGVILAACVVFIKAFAGRRTGLSSRHGAYEKVGA
jgi:hypothetical protein